MKLVRITISPKEAQLVLKYAERALLMYEESFAQRKKFFYNLAKDAAEKVELLSCRKGIERMKDSLKRSEKRSLRK